MLKIQLLYFVGSGFETTIPKIYALVALFFHYKHTLVWNFLTSCLSKFFTLSEFKSKKKFSETFFLYLVSYKAMEANTGSMSISSLSGKRYIGKWSYVVHFINNSAVSRLLQRSFHFKYTTLLEQNVYGQHLRTVWWLRHSFKLADVPSDLHYSQCRISLTLPPQMVARVSLVIYKKSLTLCYISRPNGPQNKISQM